MILDYIGVHMLTGDREVMLILAAAAGPGIYLVYFLELPGIIPFYGGFQEI